MEARDISQSRSQPFQVSLRIRHPSIDPTTISRELKIEPEHSFKAGEPRESTSGNVLTSLHAESYWLGSLKSVAAPSPLAGFADTRVGGTRERISRDRLQAANLTSLTVALDACVLTFLKPHAEFIRRMQSEDGQVCLLVELSTKALSGFNLSPQLTRTVGELGIAIEFDFTAN